jgi:hypothetical protein
MNGDKKHTYTCSDYRQERTLLALKMRLSNNQITEKERRGILSEIREIELAMEMD